INVVTFFSPKRSSIYIMTHKSDHLFSRHITHWLVSAVLTILSALLVAPPSHARSPASALGESAIGEGKARVKGELLFDVAQVTAGETFRVGVLFTLDPDWHIYWHSPGEAGLATDLLWQTPGLSVGPTQWPAPYVFSESGGYIITHGYKNEVL